MQCVYDVGSSMGAVQCVYDVGVWSVCTVALLHACMYVRTYICMYRCTAVSGCWCM